MFSLLWLFMDHTIKPYLSFLWIWLLLGAIHLLMAFVYKAPELFTKKSLAFFALEFLLKQLLHFFPAFQLSYRLFKPISLRAVEGSPFLIFWWWVPNWKNNKITPPSKSPGKSGFMLSGESFGNHCAFRR